MSDLSSPLNVGPELFLLDLGIDLHLQGARVPGHPVSQSCGRPTGGAFSQPSCGSGFVSEFLSFKAAHLELCDWLHYLSCNPELCDNIFMSRKCIYFGGFG